MAECEETIDLRSEPQSRVGLAALAAVRGMGPGESRVLLTREEPSLLMAGLNLQLRGALAWEAVKRAQHWRTTVRPAADTPPKDLIDLLARDHRRLDDTLARALRRLNAADAGEAKRLLEAFAAGLGRHVRAEDGIVAHALESPAGYEPLEIMLREHVELLAQLRAVEQCFAEAPPGALPQAWEVEPFVAILSGTLAKHEHREEALVFPVWAAALERRPAEERAALQARVQEALAGGEAG